MPTDPINLNEARQRRPGCPICGRPADMKFKPFCSKRCADVDLARWLNGVYSVPVVEREDGSETVLPENDDMSPAS